MNDPLATVNDPLWPALEGEGVDLLSLFPRTPSMAAIQQKPRTIGSKLGVGIRGR